MKVINKITCPPNYNCVKCHHLLFFFWCGDEFYSCILTGDNTFFTNDGIGKKDKDSLDYCENYKIKEKIT